jgi:beta-galactosidase/beta-glucuronidase
MPSVERGYPRPQLCRANWQSLNGEWDFALDPKAVWTHPSEVQWDARIVVPFAPETEASTVHHTGFFRACWYRRTFAPPPMEPGQRLLLHFGAVDYVATVWCNDQFATRHEGGYTPFSVDVTALLDGRDLTIVVCADDDPMDLAKPRGKQDWQLKPHSIWYTRTTGIWQTVWWEVVPTVRIDRLRWTPNLERWEIGLEAWLCGPTTGRLRMHVHLSVGDTVIADDTFTVISGEVHRRIALSDPGIDDYRNELLWAPERPTLITARIELWADRSVRIDEVTSYTALRAVAVQRDRFVLNGRPYFLRLVLDQGYWPETGITAPDDDALRKDVELAKAMGFNGVRKHQKLEDPRYMYWADQLGLLVWSEMPSAYRFTQSSVERVSRQWTEAVTRDYSHPCIIAWVPFNESWGVPNLPDSPNERHYVQALYHLTKTLDATRPVIGNDGWESVATDMIGIHDYDSKPERIARRYHADEVLPRLFRRERPGGRLLVLGEGSPAEQPIVLSEFGGITCSNEPGTWGYSRCTTDDLAERYTLLLETVRSLAVLSGFCYTQFADTFQEANGLLRANRQPKFPLTEIFRATRGPDPRATDAVDPLAAVGLSDGSEQ